MSSARGGFITLDLQDPVHVGTHTKSVNIWRRWKQLSRFQRSTIYLLLAISSLVVVYLHKNKIHNVHGTPRPSQQGAAGHIPPKVQIADEEGVVKPAKLGPDTEDHNVAMEVKEDDEDNKDNDLNHNPPDVDEGGDSNNALESRQEEDGQDELKSKNGGIGQDSKSKRHLPPPNGSLKFGGPQNERQRAVVSAFKHAWSGYRTHAWGRDHLKPISKTYQTWFDVGLTLIDSLDTMLIMNLREEFDEARDWVATNLNFDKNRDVNLFETTIRVLGGLLSAYHLSDDSIFLEKAQDLGDRMMGAFDTMSGIPFSDVNLKTRRGHAPKWSPDSSTSEVTTIQLEFRDLSRSTGQPQYEEAVARVSEIVHELDKTMGLVPIYINANSGVFRQYSTITLGARGDSYYEYLLKQWIQTGKSISYLRHDFNLAIAGVMDKLVRRTKPNNLLFIGEILSGGKDFKPKMDELVCFLPGTLALGVHNGLPSSHMDLAQELAYSCYLTFARQPTFLAPEISYFNTGQESTKDFYCKPNDAHYLLRPETIESLWYLYYFTGNKTYQDWGWNIFKGIESYTKVSSGYTTISNVRNPLDTRPKDMMESFFLGETLKYLYLLFADRHEIDLNSWVINTEAHILPIHSS